MLEVALAEARKGLEEGGIPIGAAIFDADGQLLGSGHNRRVQHGDPSMHGETDAFRNAGRQRSYRNLIMVTTAQGEEPTIRAEIRCTDLVDSFPEVKKHG